MIVRWEGARSQYNSNCLGLASPILKIQLFSQQPNSLLGETSRWDRPQL
ncbi:hypothetical protein [Microcoleus sp. CZ3-B4]